MNEDLPIDEAGRLAVVRSLGVLDTPPEPAFDAIVASLARLTGCPAAVVSIVDENRLWFKASVGLDTCSLPRRQSFCAYAILGKQLFEVPDLGLDPRFRLHPLVAAEGGLRFYAGYPLVVMGHCVGTLCVLDHAPRQLSPEGRASMTALASTVCELLVSRRRLHEAERHRQRLVDFSRLTSQVLWESDAQHRCVWVSRSAASAAATEPASFGFVGTVGQPIVDEALISLGGVALESGSSYLDLLRREADFDAAVTLRATPEGPMQVLRSAVARFDSAGGFAGYRGSARDYSAEWRADEERAQLQRRHADWELLAGAARLGLARLHLADGSVQLDERACHNHGLPYPAPRLTLSDWMNSVELVDRAAAASGVRRTLTDGESFEGRYRVRRPDGQVRWLEFVVRASRNAEGAIDGLTGICRDVHDQQSAAQVERVRQDAERAGRHKSQFLSRVSHELRTPLNGILGFAQLMARDAEHPLPPKQAERLQSMQRAGTHLLGLINDVLDISRTDAGENPLALRTVPLLQALDTLRAAMHPLAQERGIDVQCIGSLADPSLSVSAAAPPADDAPSVRAEPHRLQQVLSNLLSNAIKFSPPASRVTLGWQRRLDQIGIVVRDLGPGLDADQRSRLFQPFDRLGAERLQVEGIGLGLYLARQLAEAMGGHIDVNSERGAGSTFTLWLSSTDATMGDASEEDEPMTDDESDIEADGAFESIDRPVGREPVRALDAPASATVPQQTQQSQQAPQSPEARARHQLVYIEDEALNQLLLQEMLRSRPEWELHIADTGASGLTLARALMPALLLIDINLPDTNGMALVRQLRADPATQHLRCIALSADAMREQIDAALQAGFDDYWTKPLDVSVVLGAFDTLRRTLDR